MLTMPQLAGLPECLTQCGAVLAQMKRVVEPLSSYFTEIRTHNPR